MLDVPANIATHLAQEVTSLTWLIDIRRSDGIVVSLTTLDRSITVGGVTYSADIPIQMTSIQSRADLSNDNGEIKFGLDGTQFVEDEIRSGDFANAEITLSIANWEAPEDGAVIFKRGTLGDYEITKDVSVTFHYRGLTYALNRPIVQKYSQTCRVAFGSDKCGVPVLPTRIRRPGARVKSFDWYAEPVANVTAITVSNEGFESDLTGWVTPTGSDWDIETSTPHAGSKYVKGGSPSGITANSGRYMYLQRSFTLATEGMANVDVDDGDYTVDLSAMVSTAVSGDKNPVGVFIAQYDANGKTLRREESKLIQATFGEWEGVGVTSAIIPGCRTITIGLINRVDFGTTGNGLFDSVKLRYWTNQADTFNSKSYRIVRIPGARVGSNESSLYLNGYFDALVSNGTSGISSWTYGSGSYWKTVTNVGAVEPVRGSYFLVGGDDGSSTPASVYTLSQTKTIVGAYTGVTEANIDAGKYFARAALKTVRLHSGSAFKVKLEALSAADAILASNETVYDTTSTVGTWNSTTVKCNVPSGTRKLRITLYARSGADSNAQVGFDAIEQQFLGVSSGGTLNSRYGFLGDTVTLDQTVGEYAFDGEIAVQARTSVFRYASVTAVTSRRVFEASGATGTAANLYSGRILWLSGTNAGRYSYTRVFNATSKEFSMYAPLPNDIQVGDKFIYTEGCDKTIARCGTGHGNAVNFRGEPYIPGPNTILSFARQT